MEECVSKKIVVKYNFDMTIYELDQIKLFFCE